MVVDKTNALLQVKGITVRFGGITALDNVSFDLPRDKVCGLIGPNGAGKTGSVALIARGQGFAVGRFTILMQGGFVLPARKTGLQKTSLRNLAWPSGLCESCASIQCRPAHLQPLEMT